MQIKILSIVGFDATTKSGAPARRYVITVDNPAQYNLAGFNGECTFFDTNGSAAGWKVGDVIDIFEIKPNQSANGRMYYNIWKTAPRNGGAGIAKEIEDIKARLERLEKASNVTISGF
jgi:hypothetical protein